MADTTHLVLPLMAAAQSQKHVTHNDALLILDALVQLSVADRNLTAPPGGPTEGDRYIIGSGATGAWAGKDLNVATWIDGAWLFLVPREGWIAWVEDENLLFVWNGTAWTDLATAGGFVLASELATDLETGEYDLLGINGATADTTNRLAVNTPAVLFNRGTDDIVVKLNKQAAADDAAFSLQTNFSTRLLFGTLGNDDTSLRVSPDGSTFYDALVIDKDDGTATMLRLGLGGATADAANRLSVTSPAILFNRGTDDIDVKLNKQAAADDARFTFQTNFSTRALIGTIGNDDFSISVSPDGSTFYSAMAIDKDTGNVAIGTSSDANNRLLVSGSNMLFTSSGDLAFTFNKGAAGDDASLTFQSGFSARALVGLLGDDDFTFKVTPDGSSYYTSFVIDKDNGQVNFKQLTGHERGYTTVVSNAITVTAGFMNLTGAGPVTLSTINGGFDGAEVTIQHTGGGTLTITNSGNIKTIGATSMTLDNWNDTATFICNGTGTWLCKAFCNNG